MSNYEIIRQAIIQRKSVTCIYNGHRRMLTPHLLGYRKGICKALFFQYEGKSTSGLSENPNNNWRCLEVDKLRELSMNRDKFHTASNYNINQMCIVEVEVGVRMD